MGPKIDPGGLRRPLRSQVGAQRLRKSLPEAAGSSKKQFWRAQEAPGAIFERFSWNLRPKWGGPAAGGLAQWEGFRESKLRLDVGYK